MKVRLKLNHWRNPLSCTGHEPAHQHTPWPKRKHVAIGPLIPLHHHNPYGPCVLAWRVWIYTRRGGRLIDLTFDDRRPDDHAQ